MRADRRRSRDAHRELHARVEALLRAHDVVGLIEMGAPPDEYDGLASRVLARLPTARSAADVQTIAFEAFVDGFDAWFGGAPERYQGVGAEIWRVWLDSPISKSGSR